MSVQAGSTIPPILEPRKTKDKFSKKRKHEDATGEASLKKKVKHREEHDEEVVDDDVSQKANREKRKIVQRRDAEEVPAQPAAEPVKDLEKKKRRRQKHKEPEEVPGVATNGVVQNEDIELPDAPRLKEVHIDPSKSNEPEKARRRRKRPKDTKPIPEPTINGAEADEDTDLLEIPIVHAPQASLSPVPGEAEPNAQPTANDTLQIEEKSLGVDFLASPDPSCFYSTRLSLYLSIPAITLPQHARKAVLSMHLAPLLLQYYPPAKGIVIAFENPVLSAKANSTINLPLAPPSSNEAGARKDEGIMKEIFTQASDQFGIAWVWLTVTLLVFRPQRGDEMYAFNNISSEGFVGLVSYNYFQTAVGASRIPSQWKWRGTATEQRRRKKGRKERMLEDGRREQSSPAPSSSIVADDQTREEIETETGFFLESGEKVAETLKYRVVDTEMVPGGEKGRWSLHIDASLLDEEGERRLLEEEREKWERRYRLSTPGLEMSGGLGMSREGSGMSAASSAGPAQRHRIAY